jgi:hypothetical protein
MGIYMLPALGSWHQILTNVPWGMELEGGTTMQLPTVFRSSTHLLPPMYAWPRSVKRALLTLSVLAVITAYLLLAGGVIAALAVLAERVSH